MRARFGCTETTVSDRVPTLLAMTESNHGFEQSHQISAALLMVLDENEVRWIALIRVSLGTMLRWYDLDATNVAFPYHLDLQGWVVH